MIIIITDKLSPTDFMFTNSPPYSKFQRVRRSRIAYGTNVTLGKL